MEHQPETTLVELIRYNNWANAQVLAACQRSPPTSSPRPRPAPTAASTAPWGTSSRRKPTMWGG